MWQEMRLAVIDPMLIIEQIMDEYDVKVLDFLFEPVREMVSPSPFLDDSPEEEISTTKWQTHSPNAWRTCGSCGNMLTESGWLYCKMIDVVADITNESTIQCLLNLCKTFDLTCFIPCVFCQVRFIK